MNNLKQIIKVFILIPNIPCIIVLSIYIVVNLYIHTGIIEMEFIDDDDLFSDKIKNHINKIYPKHFRYLVAFAFYVWIGVDAYNF